MSESIHKYAEKGHSQNGEWGIINECLKRIGYVPGKLSDKYVAVEFGAADGLWCSNTADISLTYRGWKRILYDVDPKGVEVVKAEITTENVNVLVPQDCSVLSMDTDGPDYEIWEAYKGSPDIVIIEINSSIDPNVDFYTKDKGANFSIMNKLAGSKGYFLLCHTGNNIYLLNKWKELFPDADQNFKTDWL